MSSSKFRRETRLRKASEFEACQTQGKRYHSSQIVVVLRKCSEPARLGVVVSRHTGGAVVRNRWKRMIREAFRTEGRILSSTGDHVVIVRRSVKGKPDGSTRTELLTLFEKAGR